MAATKKRASTPTTTPRTRDTFYATVPPEASATKTTEAKHDPFGPTDSADRDETGYEPGSRMSNLVKDLKDMGAR